MRVVGLVLAGTFAIAVPIAGHADGPKLNLRPANQGATSNILPVWEGGGRSGGHSGAIGGHTAAGRAQQSNGGPHWGPNGRPFGWGRYAWQGVPTYWVWVPGSAVFDYPFADWRGPTGGWGNP
jgi:hypothetical protein